MGFLSVVHTEEIKVNELASVWPDAVRMWERRTVSVSSANLKSGMKLIVEPFQILVQLREKKVVDVIDRAGGYVYHPELVRNEKTAEYTGVLEAFLEENSMVTDQTELLCISSPEPIETMEQLQKLLVPEPQKEVVQEAEKQRYSFCPECGADIRMYPNAKFCMKCGKELSL